MNENTLFSSIAPHIYHINNQYFYSEKVHTYLIELKDKILLIDMPTYSNELKDFILSFKKKTVAILSHGSCGIEDGTKWQNDISLKVYMHKADANHPWIRMQADILFTKMPFFDDSIEILHTPGHSKGSICVLENKSKSLFTGDTFYADENGNIKDFTQERHAEYENLEERIESCKKLAAYDFINVFPFHYHKILNNGQAKLHNFILAKAF